MKRRHRGLYIFVILITLILGTACTNSNNRPRLLVATAANMQFAMEELILKFALKYDVDCELVLSSSGKLTAQIKEGAPYDVFVSADMKYPNDLAKAGKNLNSPKVYAYGKLVLWTLNPDIIPNLENLSNTKIEHIALANPKTAPYGKAALETLTYYNLKQSLTPKLVFGESISQTNQFIHSGAVEIGFTAKSVVLSKPMKNQGRWVEVDELAYNPIEQGIVVLKQPEKDHSAAMNFYNFMFSDEAKEILTQFGYTIRE